MIKRRYFIYLILLLALILRLIVINQSFWLDEAIGALVVKNQTFSQITTQFVKSDNHPPLYYLLLKLWTNLFGYSEVAIRGLSVFLGVITIYLTFLIAKLLSKKNNIIPVITALFLATSPLHIYYSQEARMYITAGFFAASSVYFYLKTLSKGKSINWILFSVSITALVFTDYVPVFLLPAFWLFALFRRKKLKWWKNFVISHLPLLVSGLLWLPIFLHQIERGRWLMETLPAWRQVAGGATIKQIALVWMKFVLGRISFFNKTFYYSLIIVASIPFIFLLYKAWQRKKEITFVWFWFLVPLSLGFLASFMFPAFIYFRFVFVIPAFYLLVSWGLGKLRPNLAKKAILISILSLNLLGWFFYSTQPRQQREQWRQAVSFVEGKAKEGEIVLFDFPEPVAPYQWYEKGIVEAYGATDSISSNQDKTIQITKKLISNKSGIYYFEYLRGLTDPERYVERVIENEGFTVQEIYDFIGVGQIIYYKVR